MRNILIVLFVLAVLWPFSCTPQTGGINLGNDGCDTVYMESPRVGAFQSEIARLKGENNGIKGQLEDCQNANVQLEASLAAAMATITDKNAEIDNLRETNQNLSDQLQACLDKPADTVIVEVTKPTDIDEVIMEFCFSGTNLDSTGYRDFIHEGSVTEYPHFVSIASKNRGMMKVWFETPLDSTIKVAKSWTLERRRNYEQARTEYIYKDYTPF
jgi:FtsZ-binding cell division protein ZapB